MFITAARARNEITCVFHIGRDSLLKLEEQGAVGGQSVGVWEFMLLSLGRFYMLFFWYFLVGVDQGVRLDTTYHRLTFCKGAEGCFGIFCLYLLFIWISNPHKGTTTATGCRAADCHQPGRIKVMMYFWWFFYRRAMEPWSSSPKRVLLCGCYWTGFGLGSRKRTRTLRNPGLTRLSPRKQNGKGPEKERGRPGGKRTGSYPRRRERQKRIILPSCRAAPCIHHSWSSSPTLPIYLCDCAPVSAYVRVFPVREVSMIRHLSTKHRTERPSHSQPRPWGG
ncbi:hypothetical protein B0T25DRAFT_157252 [Lasiosphaeria hispida]|uniref:Uncharacterized protein n=1 Tax=Lasiosphaeria hispida TaxID=260671 RepID=A0AAJ0HMP7_9PEZI|nr:hypothetical protein B0T25DRAFT_157252 [Lasiosphaeria hispida]